MQCQRSVCKKPDTKGSRAIKIKNQTFDHFSMVFGWRMHKLGEFIHGKGNIQPSHLEMLKATNHMMVHGGIYGLKTICNSQRSIDGKQGGDRFGV